MEPSIRFRIFPCYEEDLNKTVVRIDEKHMHTLGIKSGDIVMLTGGRKTYATCLPLDPSKEPVESDLTIVYLDEASKNVPMIRLSNLTSSNARLAGAENTIEVSSAIAVEASKIVLGTMDKFSDEQTPLILDQVRGMVLSKNDYVFVSNSGPHRTIGFQVLDADPAGDAYMVSKNTRVEIRNYVSLQAFPEAKLDTLVKVIPIVKQIKNERFALTLPSLEVYDQLSLIHIYLTNKFGNAKQRMYCALRPTMNAYDDLGNSYMITSHGGGGFGGFRYWGPEASFEEYEAQFTWTFMLTPTFDPNAKELTIVIREMVWDFHEPPPLPPAAPAKISEGKPGVHYLTPVKMIMTIASGPWEFKMPLK